MAIYRLIADESFGPDEIKVMTAAYELALVDLGIIDRNDPLTELTAKAIVSAVAIGERDPQIILQRALNALGIHRTAA
jgi:hypothetical protein